MSNPETLHLNKRLAEAARYALMRRLAPAIRHNMAGSLQPISMISAMLERRLQAPVPDMAQLGKNSRDIGALSREAAATCMSLMTWLVPKDNELIAVNEGVQESIGLIATELSFKGFGIENETGHVDIQVPRCVLRSVFMASVIALTDGAQSPATVVLTAGVAETDLFLRMTLVAAEGEGSPNQSHAYRNLEWPDVQALADAEGASLCVAGAEVELRHRLPGGSP